MEGPLFSWAHYKDVTEKNLTSLRSKKAILGVLVFLTGLLKCTGQWKQLSLLFLGSWFYPWLNRLLVNAIWYKHTQALKEGNIFNKHALRAKYMWVHWHRSFPSAELFCCNTMPSLVRSRQFIPLVTPPGLIEQLRVTLEFGSTVIWFTRHSLDREQDSLISQSGLKLFAADTSVEWKKVNNIWKFC